MRVCIADVHSSRTVPLCFHACVVLCETAGVFFVLMFAFCLCDVTSEGRTYPTPPSREKPLPPGCFYKGIPVPRILCHGRTKLKKVSGTGMNLLQNPQKFQVFDPLLLHLYLLHREPRRVLVVVNKRSTGRIQLTYLK